MRKQRLFISLFMCLLLLPAAGHAEEYAFILGNGPYWSIVEQGIKNVPGSSGAVIYRPDAQISAAELDLCRNIIQRSPRFLGVAAINPNVSGQCLKLAADAGIAVGDLGGAVAVDDAKKQDYHLAYTLSADSKDAGAALADYLKSVETRPVIKLLIIGGSEENEIERDYIDGFKSRLKQSIPGAIISAPLYTDGDTSKARGVVAGALASVPDIDVIFASDGAAALGASDAVRATGRGMKIKILCVGGSPEVRKAITDGYILASDTQLPYLMGKRAMELAIETGQRGGTAPVDMQETIPILILNKNTLSSNNNPLVQYLR